MVYNARHVTLFNAYNTKLEIMCIRSNYFDDLHFFLPPHNLYYWVYPTLMNSFSKHLFRMKHNSVCKVILGIIRKMSRTRHTDKLMILPRLPVILNAVDNSWSLSSKSRPKFQITSRCICQDNENKKFLNSSMDSWFLFTHEFLST